MGSLVCRSDHEQACGALDLALGQPTDVLGAETLRGSDATRARTSHTRRTEEQKQARRYTHTEEHTQARIRTGSERRHRGIVCRSKSVLALLC